MRPVQFLPLLAIALFLGCTTAFAQRSSFSPPEIYPGENIITISSAAGIRSVQVRPTSPTSLAYMEARKTGIIGGCPKTYDIELSIGVATNLGSYDLIIERCDNRVDTIAGPGLNTTWNLDEVAFPDAEIDEEVCREFQVRLSGGLTIGSPRSVILDSITSPDPRVKFRLPFPLPVTISGGSYVYVACFKADKPGIYKFPVITWLKRQYPVGELTTYPVADTGVIRVVRNREAIGLREIPLEFDTVGADNPPPVVDPTTFRSVAIPNAVRPKRGRFFIGSYDIIGLTAGYAVADELLLFAGGAPPLPDDWGGVNGDMFGAWAVGGKVGTTIGGKLDLAAGFVIGQSILDKEFTAGQLDSKINLRVPFGAISYGTDDSRVSVTGGYAFKTHETFFPFHPAFGENHLEVYDTNAVFGSIGGDYRLGRHWKIAGEAAYMQTVDVLPIIATARYFTNSFAIDLGVGFVGITLNNAEAPKFPLAPVLSGVFVFGGTGDD